MLLPSLRGKQREEKAVGWKSAPVVLVLEEKKCWLKACICAVQEVHNTLGKVDKALKYVCLQWAAAGVAGERHDVGAEGKGKGAVKPGERSGPTTLQSTVSTVHAARAVTAVHPFTKKLP